MLQINLDYNKLQSNFFRQEQSTKGTLRSLFHRLKKTQSGEYVSKPKIFSSSFISLKDNELLMAEIIIRAYNACRGKK